MPMIPANTNTITDKVFIEQIMLLYNRPPARVLVHIIPAIFIYILARKHVGEQFTLIWLGVLMLVNVLRYIDISIIVAKLGSNFNYSRLEKRFAAGSALVGIAYGAGLYLMLPQLPTLNQIAIMAVVIAVIPGAMVFFATSKLSFQSYCLPSLGLPLIQCLQLGDTFYIYIVIFGCIYIYIINILFNWQYDVLIEAINVRLTNQELVLSLTDTNKKLAMLSTIDALTNLSNRRHFDDMLEKEFLRAQRAKTYISLIMLDIDYFKQYNDEYGHLAGDNCLKLISAVLRENVKRPGDLVARYGGEEFCVIMPETDQTGALALAGQIKDALMVLKIPHVKSTTGHVTVSIGTATTVPGLQVTSNMLVNAADKALYTAKNDGRNNIRSSSFTAQ